jgi:biotin-(acetyl-CoA carboxylase) ligase
MGAFVLAADRQTAGRGRRGGVAILAGAGLTFSVLWRFAPGAPLPGGLSLVVGLAVARALEELGVEGVQLKWPNDVLVNGHKIAGILIELVSGRGQPLAAVIGVGINLRLPPEAAIESPLGVTDLARCLDAPPPASRLLGLVLAQLHHFSASAPPPVSRASGAPGSSAMPLRICRCAFSARPSRWPASVRGWTPTARCCCRRRTACAGCCPATCP